MVKRINYKMCLIVGIVGLIVIILTATFIEIKKDKKQKEYDYIIANIILVAKKCVETNNCEKRNVSLKELYEKKLIKKTINPLNNDYFNDNSIVLYPEYVFIIEE